MLTIRIFLQLTLLLIIANPGFSWIYAVLMEFVHPRGESAILSHPSFLVLCDAILFSGLNYWSMFNNFFWRGLPNHIHNAQNIYRTSIKGFIIYSVVNAIIARYFDTDSWIIFKLYGIPTLLLVVSAYSTYQIKKQEFSNEIPN